MTEKIQSDSKTAGFFERAQIPGISNRGNEGDGGSEHDSTARPSKDDSVTVTSKKPGKPVFRTPAEKTEYIKGLKKKIESETDNPKTIVSKTNMAAMIDAENAGDADPETAAVIQSIINESEVINSGLPMSGGNNEGSTDDEDAMADRIYQINIAAAQSKHKGSDGGYNAKDVAALQKLVDKAQGGTSGGSFSRRG